jgi:hypothetical protein
MRKNYFIDLNIIDLATGKVEGTRNINFSDPKGRAFMERVIFSCLNNEKGVTIELDKATPEK